MDQNQNGQHQHATRGTSTPPATQTHHGINWYQPNHMMMETNQVAGPSSAPSPYLIDQQQYAHHYMHQLQQQQELQQKLNTFWENHYREIEETTDFRNHSLPLARIKKIMKADEEVKMISAEAPVIFAKACEMFIMELTMRAWANAEENKRRTLQKNDIAAAVTKTDVFDFLVDVVPRDETMDLDLYSGIRRRGGANINVPYYYGMPPHQHVVDPPYHPYGPPPPPPPPRVVMGGVASVVPDQQGYYYGPQTHPFVAQVCPKQQDHSSDSDD